MKKAWRARPRSSVFVLPEFVDRPDISLVVWLDDSKEAEALADIADPKVEIGAVVPSAIELDHILHSCVFDPNNMNACMAMNDVAVKMSGKVLVLANGLKNVLERPLEEHFASIRSADENIVVAQNQGPLVALALDHYYNARGLDELMPDLSTAMADLALRVEMMGARLTGDLDKNHLSPEALRRVETSDLLVNEGAEHFPRLWH